MCSASLPGGCHLSVSSSCPLASGAGGGVSWRDADVRGALRGSRRRGSGRRSPSSSKAPPSRLSRYPPAYLSLRALLCECARC
eukprot:2575637-Rhodomonas_salina.4